MSKKRGRPRKAKPNSPILQLEELDDTTCGMCFAEFLDPQDLQLHFEQVHGNEGNSTEKGIVKCEFCIQKFSDAERLVIHIRNDHLKNLSVCKYCFRCFLNGNECCAHKKQHLTSNNSTYSCSNCEEKFNFTKELELHEFEAHQNGNGVFLHKYYSLLSSVLNVQVEFFLKSLGTDAAYICTKCTYSNSNLDRYLKHLKMSNCRSEACDKCFFVYQNHSAINKHLAKSKACRLSPNDADMYKQCPKCSQKVLHSIYIEHKNNCKAVKCQHCNIILQSGIEFAEHYSKSHPQSMSVHSCTYCSKYFSGDTALQKHYNRIHKPELHLYKYKCTDCVLVFKHPNQLFSHFLRKHPDVLPFTCKICDKSFKVRRRFTIHIKLEHKSIGNVRFTENFHVVFEEKPITEDNDSSNDLTEENNDKSELTNEILSNDEKDPVNVSTDLDDDNKKAKEHENSVEETRDSDREGANIEKVSDGEVKEDVIEVKETTVTKKTETRKRKADEPMSMIEFLESDGSDDEPLVNIARKTKRFKKTRKRGKGDLSCKICNKKCFTILNYKQHMAMHKKNQSQVCIKCNASFKSEQALKLHYNKLHSKSALTETLKRLLKEKRKSFVTHKKPTQSKPEVMIEKFRNTIKKVEFKKSDVVATITEIKLGDPDPIQRQAPEHIIKINTSITLKKVDAKAVKPPAIKIYKFKPPKPLGSTVKLAMPTKCNIPPPTNEHKATIKMVNITKAPPKLNFGYKHEHVAPNSETFTFYTDYDNHEDSAIPDVGHEVMLDDQSDQTSDHVDLPKTKFTHKIVIPQVTDSCGYENIRIAHLLPEAPYYKIVTVKDILQMEDKEPEKKAKVEEKYELPDGTKLVNVNPLAHLLKDKDILEPPSKRKREHKKEVTKNYQQAVAKALLKLEKTAPVKHVRKRKIKLTIPEGNRAELTKPHDIVEQSDLPQKSTNIECVKPNKDVDKLISSILHDENTDQNQLLAGEQRPIAEEQGPIAGEQGLIVDEKRPTIDDQAPTDIEYLEEFEDIPETAAASAPPDENTGPGLSLPEL